MSSHGSTSQIVAIVLAGLLIVAIGAVLSIYYGRRAKGAADWLSAPGSLPLIVVVITQFATAVGGGVLVAHVGIAYASGWSVFAYELCVVVGFVLLSLIAPWLRSQGFGTIPDVVTRLFGRSRAIEVIGGLCALIVPFGALTTQFVGFAALFGQLTGLSAPVLVIVMAVAALTFVLPGGLTSVAWTDFIFGIFKIIMSLVIAAYAVHFAGGWHGITSRVPARLWKPQGFFAVGSHQIWLWAAAVLPGTLTNQQYYQRVFATKNVRDARRGLILSGLSILIAGIYASAIGLSVRAAHPGLASSQQAAGWLITQLPSALLVIYGAFLVATIVSASGSCLQSVVTSVVRDLSGSMGRQRDADGSRLVAISRLCSVAVAAVAVSLAIAVPNALTWLVDTYAYSAAALAAPIFLGYMLHRRGSLTPVAALVSMTAGLIGCGVAQMLNTTVPYALYGIAASAVVLLAFGARSPAVRTPALAEPQLEGTAEA